MISVYRTNRGWTYHVSSKIGYYNSLAEVMDAAYAAEDGSASNSHISAVRDRPCDNCRFAEGS